MTRPAPSLEADIHSVAYEIDHDTREGVALVARWLAAEMIARGGFVAAPGHPEARPGVTPLRRAP